MASRGKRKPKLRDFSTFPLTPQEASALHDAVHRATNPISTAILGAAMVEHELEANLRRRLSRKDNDTWEQILEERGPFRSFYSKIVMGYAFRICNEKSVDDLHVIRKIRNAFAHSKKLIDFDDKLIVGELLGAHSLPRKSKNLLQRDSSIENARTAYIALCFFQTIKLIQQQTRAAKASANWYRKKLQQSPFARAAAATFSPFATASPGSPYPLLSSLLKNPLGSPGHQNENPSAVMSEQFPGSLFREPPKPDDNEGK
jgi:DNA-binding MltR family transcriptional regulator